MHRWFVYRDLEDITRAGSPSPVKGILSSRVGICCDQNFLFWTECNLISNISLNSNFLLSHAQHNISKAVIRKKTLLTKRSFLMNLVSSTFACSREIGRAFKLRRYKLRHYTMCTNEKTFVIRERNWCRFRAQLFFANRPDDQLKKKSTHIEQRIWPNG